MNVVSPRNATGHPQLACVLRSAGEMLEKIAKLADEDGRNSQRVYLIGPIKSNAGKNDEFRSITKALLSFEYKLSSHPRVTRLSDAFRLITKALLSFKHKLLS